MTETFYQNNNNKLKNEICFEEMVESENKENDESITLNLIRGFDRLFTEYAYRENSVNNMVSVKERIRQVNVIDQAKFDFISDGNQW